MPGKLTGKAILSVRVTPEERAFLEAATEQAGATLSEFMKRKSVEAAEMEVLNRSIVTIPAGKRSRRGSIGLPGEGKAAEARAA
jgi:uncharacterized protein (DUF1778 family)